MPRVVAVVLTGGRSRRMGQDKAWVEVGGRPCVERVWAACAEACDTVEFQGALAGLAAAFPGTPVWPDPAPGSGPLAGLRAALERRPGQGVLLVACDMPFVSATLLRGVAAALPGADWAAPAHAERLHPLSGAYAPAVLPVVQALLAAGRRSMHALLEEQSLTGRQVSPSPAWGDAERLLLNLNSPEDVARARGLAGG